MSDENQTESELPAYVEIPHDRLEPATLDRLIADVVLRDDTDYGDAPLSVEQRVALARRALERGELVIVFDPRSETATVVSSKELRALAAK